MTTVRIRRSVPAAVLAVSLALGAVLLTPGAPAVAAPILVTSDADTGAGTLREAVDNSAPGDEIRFHPDVTSIVLSSPIHATHTLTITGPGSDVLTITGPTLDEPFLQFAPVDADQDFTVTGMTLDGEDSAWAGIGVTDGDDWARDIVLRDLTVQDFIAIGAHIGYVSGDVLIEDSIFSGNTGSEGAGAEIINVAGDVTVRDTLFEQNEADEQAGGLLAWYIDGDVLLERVVFDRNTAGEFGGGLVTEFVGDVTILDSEFLGNTVLEGTGGGFGTSAVHSPLTITGTTFVGNVATAEDSDGDYFGAVGSAIFILGTDALVTLESSTIIGNLSSGGTALFVPLGGSVMIGFVEQPGRVVVDSTTIADSGTTTDEVTFGAGLVVFALDDEAALEIVNSTFSEATTISEDDSLDSVGVNVALGLSAGDLTIRHSTLVASMSVLVFIMDLSDGDPDDETELIGTALIENSILSRVLVLDPDEDVPNAFAFVGTFDIRHNVFTGGESFIFDSELISPYNDLGGNLFRIDPKLGPLQLNGGPTPTMMPLAGSPAIDAGTPGAVGPAYDQRGAGFDRVAAGRVDVGAVETPAILPATGQTIPEWIFIVAGVLLLGGVAAFVINAARRRGGK